MAKSTPTVDPTLSGKSAGAEHNKGGGQEGWANQTHELTLLAATARHRQFRNFHYLGESVRQTTPLTTSSVEAGGRWRTLASTSFRGRKSSIPSTILCGSSLFHGPLHFPQLSRPDPLRIAQIQDPNSHFLIRSHISEPQHSLNFLIRSHNLQNPNIL